MSISRTNLIYIAHRSISWVGSHLVAIWLIALPLLIIYAIVEREREIRAVGSALQDARLIWLAVGILIQALITLSPVLTYRVILKRLGHRLSMPELTGMHMQRIVVGTLAPVSGPAGAIVFIRALSRRAVGANDALSLLALRSASTQIAFWVLMAAVVAFQGLLFAVGVLVFVALLTSVLVPLTRRAHLPKAIGPFAWRRRLPRSVCCRVVTFAGTFRRHRLSPADLLVPVSITLSTRFAGVVLIIVSLFAVGIHPTPVMIASAALAEIVAKMSVPFFQGIGAVEVATTVALQQSGVPADAAIGAALLWRLFEFWLPLATGLLLMGWWVIWPRVPHPPAPELRAPTLPPMVQPKQLVELAKGLSGTSARSRSSAH